MKIYSAQETLLNLPYSRLISQMRELFAQDIRCPDRHSHTIPMSKESDASLLLMPGWFENIGCVKIVNVTPDNGKRNLPAISASVLVFDRQTGEHLAILDGEAVTVRRTAAASALAADYLAPQEAESLLVIGAGKIAEQLPDAFASIRPIKRVYVWNRTLSGAEKLTLQFTQQGYQATAIETLDDALGKADIISSATLSIEPLIHGKHLRGNQHIDLIGSFKPSMREADDEVLKRAKGAIFADSDFTAKESGELAIPLHNGVITPQDIAGNLSDLCRSTTISLQQSDITLFKGAGNAVMDLAAAMTAIDSQ